MNNRTKLFLLHPFLTALYFPLSLYSRNTTETSIGTLAWTAAVCLTCTGVIFGLLAFWTKRAERAAVCASIFVFFFFIYGYVFAFARQWAVDPWVMNFEPVQRPHFLRSAIMALHAALLILYLAGAALLIRWTFKPLPGSPRINGLMTLASAYLIIAALAATGVDLHRASRPVSAGEPAPSQTQTISTPDSIRYKPDVYYIILDGYARTDVLKALYKYDNSEFIGFLERLGFYVPKNSYSNYSRTLPSLASSLNMKHLGLTDSQAGETGQPKAIAGSREAKAHDKRFFGLIRNNEVMRRFKRHGYRIVNLASTWSATMSLPQADIRYKYGRSWFKTEFDQVLFGTSLFKAFDIGFRQDLANWHLYNFHQMPKLAELKSPKFVFAHFVLPHSPYVFDRNGNALKEVRYENMWDKETNDFASAQAYRDQLIFTSRKAAEMIEQILRRSKTPPIIIVQADHGMNLVVNSPFKLVKTARHAIFSSYYFPDGDYSRLYDSISPVNTFRVILNQYFGENLELLQDASYYTGT